MPKGTVRYWAAAKSAAGLAEEPYDAATLADALNAVRDRHPGELAASCGDARSSLTATPWAPAPMRRYVWPRAARSRCFRRSQEGDPHIMSNQPYGYEGHQGYDEYQQPPQQHGAQAPQPEWQGYDESQAAHAQQYTQQWEGQTWETQIQPQTPPAAPAHLTETAYLSRRRTARAGSTGSRGSRGR